MSFSMFRGINDSVNSVLDPVFQNDTLSAFIKLFLVLYGGYAAPQLPVSFAPYMANTYTRIAIMVMLIWIWNHDPGVAIVVSVCYYLSLHYLMKNGLSQIAQTGTVSEDISNLISGGPNLTIKPSSVIRAEAQMMQASVNASAGSGPQAMLSSGVSTASSAVIPNVISSTSANAPTMMDVHPEHSVPLAHTPDDIHSLAVAPK